MKQGIGLKYALAGLMQAFRTERNMRIHLVAAAAAVTLAAFARLDIGGWLWVLFAIAFVFCAELINSALERLADLASGSKRHPLAKAAKDMGAASVAVAALFALMVAALVLVPALAVRMA